MTDADSLLATFDHRAPYDIRCPPHSIAHAREIIATGRLCDAGDHDWIELDGEYWRECRACGIADVTAADVGQSIATPHAGWQRRRSARGRRMVAVGYVPTNPSVRVRGEYHYTALEDNDAFQALLARHDLQYDGAWTARDTDVSILPANPFIWGRPDETLQLSREANPLSDDHYQDVDEYSSGETGHKGARPGYLSYVTISGEYAFSKPLWDDIAEACEYNKGMFRPLAPADMNTDDIPDEHWPGRKSR